MSFSTDWNLPWKMHLIEGEIGASLQGADGVRGADINGDGLLDVTVGFEQSGVTKAYLHPGPDYIKEPWKSITITGTPDVEDAHFADLDLNGSADLVIYMEGDTARISVKFDVLDPSSGSNSSLSVFPESKFKKWMYGAPFDINGDNRTEILVGAKESGEKTIGWLLAPNFQVAQDSLSMRDLNLWKYYPVGDADWTMSLKILDVNADGYRDILISDREGPTGLSGFRWLENPGTSPGEWEERWIPHSIANFEGKAMFFGQGDINGDEIIDIVLPTKHAPKKHGSTNRLIWYKRSANSSEPRWTQHTIDLNAKNNSHPIVGDIKAAGIADIDGDGKNDIIVSMERNTNEAPGVLWARNNSQPEEPVWDFFPIADNRGIKFDDLLFNDLDSDGDLDIITTEEKYSQGPFRGGLGVVWYENPAN